MLYREHYFLLSISSCVWIGGHVLRPYRIIVVPSSDSTKVPTASFMVWVASL